MAFANVPPGVQHVSIGAPKPHSPLTRPDLFQNGLVVDMDFRQGTELRDRISGTELNLTRLGGSSYVPGGLLFSPGTDELVIDPSVNAKGFFEDWRTKMTLSIGLPIFVGGGTNRIIVGTGDIFAPNFGWVLDFIGLAGANRFEFFSSPDGTILNSATSADGTYSGQRGDLCIVRDGVTIEFWFSGVQLALGANDLTATLNKKTRFAMGSINFGLPSIMICSHFRWWDGAYFEYPRDPRFWQTHYTETWED